MGKVRKNIFKSWKNVVSASYQLLIINFCFQWWCFL